MRAESGNGQLFLKFSQQPCGGADHNEIIACGYEVDFRRAESTGNKHFCFSGEFDAGDDVRQRGIFDEIDDLTVEGTVGDYGLYIDSVNGVLADYAADGAYWSIYVNGEYGNYSADMQPVADGDVFGLVYTVYEE